MSSVTIRPKERKAAPVKRTTEVMKTAALSLLGTHSVEYPISVSRDHPERFDREKYSSHIQVVVVVEVEGEGEGE